jgi:hypothetical protein
MFRSDTTAKLTVFCSDKRLSVLSVLQQFFGVAQGDVGQIPAAGEADLRICTTG